MLAITIVGAAVLGGAEVAKIQFDLPADLAARSLKVFARQSGVEVLISAELGRVTRTRAVKGEFTPREALDLMLSQTGLAVNQDRETGVMAVARAPKSPPPADQAPDTQASAKKKSEPVMTSKNPIAALVGWIAVTLAPATATSAAETAPRHALGGTASVTVIVSSSETHNALQGAMVKIPELNRTELTDSTGQVTIANLPAGAWTLVASYTGFADEQRRFETSATRALRLGVALKSRDVVMLDKFTVASEREGSALAFTEMRNATNVKDVVAMDSFGSIPSMGVGEVAMRLPGVMHFSDGNGVIGGVQIRGMDTGFTRITVDGLPPAPGADRNPQMNTFSGAIYEQLELIKGQMPDKSAESLGGMINLKSRSALTMGEKRRFNYTMSTRWTPSFFDNPGFYRRHPFHPELRFGYMERFDAFGGERNVGVAVNLYYTERVTNNTAYNYTYQNTTDERAYVSNFLAQTFGKNLRILSGSVRVDYRLSETTRFTVTMDGHIDHEPSISNISTTAAASSTVATLGPDGQPTGTGVILPNTPTMTSTRAIAGSTLSANSSILSTDVYNPTVTFSAEHTLGRWAIDYSASHSISKQLQRADQSEPKTAGGNISQVAAAVGWRLDFADPEQPILTQTGGRSISDINSYDNPQLTVRNTFNDKTVSYAELNAAFTPDLSFPLKFKSGLSFRQNTKETSNDQWVARFVGTKDRLPVGFDEVPDELAKRLGTSFPRLEPRVANAEAWSGSPLWVMDPYNRLQTYYTSASDITEEVSAGYVMARAKLAQRLSVITGIRYERTETDGTGYSRRQVPATAAQIPDPVARAHHDYNHPIQREGSYSRPFPSVHLAYEVTADLKAQASWSTSYGRPNFGQLVPGVTINDTARTVTVNNPALGPQYAKNLDLTLSYYLKPAGMVSVGYFQKDIKDYIATTTVGLIGSGADNGFDGEFVGYDLRTNGNLGTGEVTGWEAAYRQQFHFLPGLLKGIEFGATYTALKSQGNFGGTAARRNGELAGFIPKSYNLDLGYNYGPFGVRALLNYRDDYLFTFSNTPGLRVYTKGRTVINLQTTYRWRPAANFFVNIDNINNEADINYRNDEKHVTRVRSFGTAISLGVSGRF